ncbi:MAG: AAA family ATPase [Dehalococcoidia bacterium]
MIRGSLSKDVAMQKIAITGKGGSGKTAITAILIELLAREGNQSILAIDADSSGGLPFALGMRVKKTVTQIRQDMIEDPYARDEIYQRQMSDVMSDIVEEGKGFHLMAMGRPEGPGCYCTTNELLKYGIDRLSNRYDITIVDCEAGPEQVNRRILNGMGLLIIVTDISTRGIHAAREINAVVQENMDIEPVRTGLVINKFKKESPTITGMIEEAGLDILGFVPDDNNLAEFDAQGRPITELPGDSPSVQAVRQIWQQINL